MFARARGGGIKKSFEKKDLLTADEFKEICARVLKSNAALA